MNATLLKDLPAELQGGKYFVGWRYEEREGKKTKVPVNARTGGYASVTDPSTWSSLKEAMGAAGRFRCSGVGRVVVTGDGYCGIDLDKCRDPQTGELTPLATTIVKTLNSYTEITSSNCGVRVWIRATLPGLRCRKDGVEIYADGRYFTLTGNHLTNTPRTIEPRQTELEQIYNMLFPGKVEAVGLNGYDEEKSDAWAHWRKVPDDELLRRARKNPKFKQLWDGDTSEYGGDDSRADSALCCHLAYWTGKDPERIERLFNHSKLADRDKWQKREDYRQRTIASAIEVTPKVWTPAAQGNQAIDGQIVLAERKTIEIRDMPDGVLDGRLGELCQKRLLRLSPLSYAWTALVAVAGTLAHQDSTLRTNVFAALVGPPQSGKSTTIDNATTSLGLDQNSPELETSMAGSAEGLLRKIGDNNGCAKLYCPDELSHLFAKAQIERASFAPIVQRCFYHTSFDMVIAKGQQFPVNCSLGIVGGIVDLKFEECFGTATTAGLYDRFVFGRSPSAFTFDYRPFDTAAERLPDPVKVSVHPGVWELKSGWLKTIPGMTGRVAENALRIASICAGFDGRTLLRAENLARALEFAKYQIRVQALLQPNPGQNPEAVCAFAILQQIDKLAPNCEWLSKRNISKAIHAERFGPGIFRRAGDNLVFNEEIERAYLGEGKKTEFWRRK